MPVTLTVVSALLGFIFFLMGPLYDKNTNIQHSPTLSSTEADYIIISYVVCKIMYVHSILQSLGFTIALLVILKVDNLGTVYLSKNVGSSIKTRYTDTHPHFVFTYCKNSIVSVKFVSKKLNKLDIMTNILPVISTIPMSLLHG